MRVRMFAAVIAALAVGACATNDADRYSRFPAAAGTESLGASTGTRLRLVLDPGPVGLPPGEVASYMDRQEAELRAEMQGTGVAVARTGSQILLTFPGNIVFQTNSADIRSDFYEVLTSLSRVLVAYDQTTIEVTGHTDATGGHKINQPLSERRADTVASYLRSQRIDNDRLSSRGLGSLRPVASSDTPAGRERNRRIEMLITPLVEDPEPLASDLALEPDAEAGLTSP